MAPDHAQTFELQLVDVVNVYPDVGRKGIAIGKAALLTRWPAHVKQDEGDRVGA
jgi:hypothetical protein